MHAIGLILTSIILSTYSYAQSVESGTQHTDDTVSNFILKTETAQFKVFDFGDGKDYLISVDGFATQKEAQAFCEKNGMTLDSESSAFWIARTGVTENDTFLRNALTFSIKRNDLLLTGAWQWSTHKNEVDMRFDSTNEERHVPFIALKMYKIKSIQAICVKELEP